METAIESFQKGYEAMGAVREDMASKDILSSMYAGQTPEEVKDPIKQTATLQSAAGMLQAKGLFSAAYKLQKQAGDLSTSVNKQQLDDLKVKQGMLEYSGQMLATATNDEDLNNAFSNIKDTSAQMNIQRVIGMKAPFEQKKKMLEDMTKSVDQHLKAQQIAAIASKATVSEDNIETDNLRQRLAVKDRDNLPKTAEEIEWEKTGILPKYQRAAKAKGETISVSEGPKSIRLNNPLNVIDSKTGEIRKFDTYEEGAAAGKADLAGKLEGTSPAYKDKFGNKPVTPERLAETWSPAGAKGNSPQATANYAKKIADAVGIDVNKPIPNTPEIRDKVFNAMAAFEAGSGYDKEETDSDITQQIRRINARATKKDQVNTGEAKTVFSQIDKKYWGNLDTASAVKEASTTLGVVREADNIANFIKDNKVKTGSVGTLTKFLDKMNPNQSVSDAKTEINKQSFSANEQILGKLVLDFANQYARSERGGSTPMATIAELKAALNSFGVDSMSPDSAVKSFKFIADHKKDKLAYTYFDGNSDAVKPRMYEGKKEKELTSKLPSSNKSAAAEAAAAGF